jgi:hypothetical protein
MDTKVIAFLVLVVAIGAGLFTYFDKVGSSASRIAEDPPVVRRETKANVESSLPDADRKDAGQVIEGLETSIQSINPAFKDIDEITSQRIQPYVDEKYFAQGNPQLYRRHRLVEIDVEAFRAQLLDAVTAADVGDKATPISVPLFEDYVITIVLDRWQKGNFGVEGAYANITGPNFATDTASFYFKDGGKMDAAVDARDGSFLIAQVSNGPYYIVMSFDKVEAFDP